MILVYLSALLLLVLGGCVCVVWAERGGPRWARGVAKVTLAAGELARASARSNGSRNGSGGSDDD